VQKLIKNSVTRKVLEFENRTLFNFQSAEVTVSYRQ